MQFKNEDIFFSPSDLITFLESPFASHMERSLLQDKDKSNLLDPKDAMLNNLQKKGYEHESAFLSSLVCDEGSFDGVLVECAQGTTYFYSADQLFNPGSP